VFKKLPLVITYVIARHSAVIGGCDAKNQTGAIKNSDFRPHVIAVIAKRSFYLIEVFEVAVCLRFRCDAYDALFDPKPL
jgi:hypothetical protein